jgi:hypothetical protein
MAAGYMISGGRRLGLWNPLLTILSGLLNPLRQRALRYKVEKGKSYLLTEKSLDRGADVFSYLLNAGYGGIVISRSPLRSMRKPLKELLKIYG